MWKKKLIKKKVNKKDFLISQTLKELSKLKRKKFNENSIVDLNEILRIFLYAKYKIHQSKTIEEVLKSLKEKHIDKKIKLVIAPIILGIYNEEYKSNERFTKEKFNKYLKETEEAIKLIRKIK